MQAHSNMGPQDHRNNKTGTPAPMVCYIPVYSCVQEKGVLKSLRKRLLLFTVQLKPFSCFYIPLKALKKQLNLRQKERIWNGTHPATSGLQTKQEKFAQPFLQQIYGITTHCPLKTAVWQ